MIYNMQSGLCTWYIRIRIFEWKHARRKTKAFCHIAVKMHFITWWKSFPIISIQAWISKRILLPQIFQKILQKNRNTLKMLIVSMVGYLEILWMTTLHMTRIIFTYDSRLLTRYWTCHVNFVTSSYYRHLCIHPLYLGSLNVAKC